MKEFMGLMVLEIDSRPDVGKRDCFNLVGIPLRSDGTIEGTNVTNARGISALVDIAIEG